MGLGWRRTQVLLRVLEHINGCVNYLLQCFGCVCPHNVRVADVHVNNLAEDQRHHIFVETVACYDVEVPRESRCHRVFASSRRAHCTNNDDVGDLLELVAFV